MKDVLFIVYYFPPMGGSGVQRPFKFAKYLRDFGWNPIILCPEPGVYQFFDNSMADELASLDLEVHRVKAKTPFHVAGQSGKSTGLITGKTAELLRKVSKKVFFPDNKKGWIKPAIEEGNKIIRKKNIELIFSSAPPFSNHIIAKQLGEQSNIPFVFDYRDLFADNHFDENESESQKQKKIKEEKAWLEKASGVVVLDAFSSDKIKDNSELGNLNTKIISHGFDPEDFQQQVTSNLDYKEGKLNWLYSGLFYEANQPDAFLNAVASLLKKGNIKKEEIHLHFQGGLDSRIKDVISSSGLKEVTSDYGYLSHQQAVANLKKADALWMISNFSKNLKQIKTGKLFEYIGTKKPILALIHEGEAQKLMKEYNAGYCASPSKKEEVEKSILEIYGDWKTKKLRVASEKAVNRHSRSFLTGELAHFFDVIVG